MKKIIMIFSMVLFVSLNVFGLGTRSIFKELSLDLENKNYIIAEWCLKTSIDNNKYRVAFDFFNRNRYYCNKDELKSYEYFQFAKFFFSDTFRWDMIPEEKRKIIIKSLKTSLIFNCLNEDVYLFLGKLYLSSAKTIYEIETAIECLGIAFELSDKKKKHLIKYWMGYAKNHYLGEVKKNNILNEKNRYKKIIFNQYIALNNKLKEFDLLKKKEIDNIWKNEINGINGINGRNKKRKRDEGCSNNIEDVPNKKRKKDDPSFNSIDNGRNKKREKKLDCISFNFSENKKINFIVVENMDCLIRVFKPKGQEEIFYISKDFYEYYKSYCNFYKGEYDDIFCFAFRFKVVTALVKMEIFLDKENACVIEIGSSSLENLDEKTEILTKAVCYIKDFLKNNAENWTKLGLGFGLNFLNPYFNLKDLNASTFSNLKKQNVYNNGMVILQAMIQDIYYKALFTDITKMKQRIKNALFLIENEFKEADKETDNNMQNRFA